MQSAISVIFPALLLIGCLDDCLGDDVGCVQWIPFGLIDVCCHICKPGSQMVKKCGPDPRDLCVPCEAGTYTIDSSQCHKCTQCIGAQTEACTTSSDTVCGCGTGYRCETARCTSCIKECERGQEPTEERTCQTCPKGTFNDRIHQKCTPWRTSCPQPGQQMMAQGTAFHDRICSNVSVAIPKVIESTTTDEKSSDEMLDKTRDNEQITICTDKSCDWWHLNALPDHFVTVIVCACLLATVIIAMVCFVICKILMKKKTENKPMVEKPPAGGPRQVMEQEDCSLCHPQQEQGGSMDSVTSQGSDSKLLPV